ncbi:hypothetical protein D3C71_1617360 [compost metagenome]
MGSAGMAIIVIVLSISSYFLRKWIVGTVEQEELSRAGRKVDLWGKVLLSLIVIACIVSMVVEDRLEGAALKWLFILTIIIATGFQAFIDWRYRKGSKEYLASLAILALGVTLAFVIL